MKKRVISIIVCFVLFISILSPLKNKAFADPFTAAQIGATAYAMFNSWGISFTAGNATAVGMNDWMSQTVEDYASNQGQSIAEAFVGQIAIDAAGKLVVSYQMYNSMISFLDWVKNAYDLSSVDFTLTNGDYNGQFLPSGDKQATSEITGVGIELVPDRYVAQYDYYLRLICYNGGLAVAEMNSSGAYGFSGNYYTALDYPAVVVYYEQIDRQGEFYRYLSRNVATVSEPLDNSLIWNGTNFIQPTVLNPNKEWTGNVDGYSAPDTNLDQLLGDVFEAVADNNLVVDGDVIDVPIPPPTPAPIDPDTPLSDVPWEGLDNNLTDLYNQGLEEIGAIGDAQDAITDAVSEQTSALEGAIADNAGVVSGAIDQAVSDIQDAISEQTQTLSESASATAEATETIAEALEDEDINWQKFDLRGLFPFCIPFDIYNMLEALDASPTAPHVQLPFVIESIGFSYTIDLDFSAFDQVAAIMRQMELIVYGIALAWATSKVIKW